MTQELLVDVYLYDDDVDIAEHHSLCQCIDCRVFDSAYEIDSDAIVKSWREDNIQTYSIPHELSA
jgi:hypothetical protein